MEKDRRIKKEENDSKKLFVNVDEHKKKTVEGLIKRAAFMRATLEDFEADLVKNGFYGKCSSRGKDRRHTIESGQ